MVLEWAPEQLSASFQVMSDIEHDFISRACRRTRSSQPAAAIVASSAPAHSGQAAHAAGTKAVLSGCGATHADEREMKAHIIVKQLKRKFSYSLGLLATKLMSSRCIARCGVRVKRPPRQKRYRGVDELRIVARGSSAGNRAPLLPQQHPHCLCQRAAQCCGSCLECLCKDSCAVPPDRCWYVPSVPA